MRCCVRSSPRTSRRLYSCTYRPSHAHRDRATYLNHLIRKYWCSGSKRVQATLRAEDRTRLLLDFFQPPRLISASAPLRTWLRANTLALSKIPAWQIPAWHCHVLEYLELSSCFFICIFIFSPLQSLIYLRGVPGSTLGTHHLIHYFPPCCINLPAEICCINLPAEICCINLPALIGRIRFNWPRSPK